MPAKEPSRDVYGYLAGPKEVNARSDVLITTGVRTENRGMRPVEFGEALAAGTLRPYGSRSVRGPVFQFSVVRVCDTSDDV